MIHNMATYKGASVNDLAVELNKLQKCDIIDILICGQVSEKYAVSDVLSNFFKQSFDQDEHKVSCESNSGDSGDVNLILEIKCLKKQIEWNDKTIKELDSRVSEQCKMITFLIEKLKDKGITYQNINKTKIQSIRQIDNSPQKGRDLTNIEGAISQNFYWRDYIPGTIIEDAVQPAEGKYIGQVYYQDILPATIYPHNYLAVAEYDGKQTFTDNIKILCSNEPERFYWEFVTFYDSINSQMENTIKGGYRTDVGQNIFIGKVYHQNEWKISKVISIEYDSKGIWIWDEVGKPVNLREFYILKYNHTNTII